VSAFFPLVAVYLPLLTAELPSLPSEARLSGPRFMVPEELAKAALEAPCTVAMERTVSGELFVTDVLSCPPGIAEWAKGSANVLRASGDAGSFIPWHFQADLPLAVDNKALGMQGSAEELAGDIAWASTPELRYRLLPSRTSVPVHQPATCSVLLHIDSSGTVRQSTPLSCPKALEAASSEVLTHWRYETRKRNGPLSLPVTLNFAHQPPQASTNEQALAYVNVPDPGLCYFEIWRDESGEILGQNPIQCPQAIWDALDVSTLFLPAHTGESASQILCLDPETGLRTAMPPPFRGPQPFRERESATLPDPSLASAAEDCQMLVQLDARHRAKTATALDCHADLQDAARVALRSWVWFDFEQQGWPPRETLSVRVPFKDIEPPPPLHVQANVMPKQQKRPSYPRDAAGHLLPAATCYFFLELDEGGQVSRTSVDSACPGPFVDAFYDVIHKWTFYPPFGDQDADGHFGLRLEFRPD
jgi:hypothetical protein